MEEAPRSTAAIKPADRGMLSKDERRPPSDSASPSSTSRPTSSRRPTSSEILLRLTPRRVRHARTGDGPVHGADVAHDPGLDTVLDQRVPATRLPCNFTPLPHTPILMELFPRRQQLVTENVISHGTGALRRGPATARRPGRSANGPAPRRRPEPAAGRTRTRAQGRRRPRRRRRPPIRPGRRSGSGRRRRPPPGAARWPPTTRCRSCRCCLSAWAASTERRAVPSTCPRTSVSTESISTSVRPMPSTARSSRSYFADHVGPQRRSARRGDLQHPRVPMVELPVLLRHQLQLLPPTPVRRLRADVLAHRRVEHQVDELGLARHVGVERHGADTEPLGDAPHGQLRQSLRVGDPDRRAHHLFHAQTRLGPPARPLLLAPQQRDRSRRVPPPLYSVAISRRSLLVIPYIVQYSRFNFVRYTELGGAGGIG